MANLLQMQMQPYALLLLMLQWVQCNTMCGSSSKCTCVLMPCLGAAFDTVAGSPSLLPGLRALGFRRPKP